MAMEPDRGLERMRKNERKRGKGKKREWRFFEYLPLNSSKNGISQN